MKSTTFCFLGTITILGIVACVPMSHRYQHDPSVEGRIESNSGSSPTNVAYFRCAQSLDDCSIEQKVDDSIIDDSGLFRLGGTRKFAAYSVETAHCHWQWKVLFSDAEQSVLGSHVFGPDGSCTIPEVVRLHCSVDKEGLVHCYSSGI